MKIYKIQIMDEASENCITLYAKNECNIKPHVFEYLKWFDFIQEMYMKQAAYENSLYDFITEELCGSDIWSYEEIDSNDIFID